METLVVVSKLKKHVRELADMNTAANFAEEISKIVHKSCMDAVERAKKAQRKTVMGRDFTLYVDDPQIKEVLVIASKIKKLIKESSDLSTSSQASDQLTVLVQRICDKAIQNAKSDKRKTVMARDITQDVTTL